MTHENANSKEGQVDFCWDIHYVQMNNIYSTIFNNATPYQAYRAGFREGCKMSLDMGDVVPIDQFKKRVHYKNYKRLLVWMSVGADTLNGWWCMYGARLGCWMTNFERDNWNWVDVRDFEWHKTPYPPRPFEIIDEYLCAIEPQNCFEKLRSSKKGLHSQLHRLSRHPEVVVAQVLQHKHRQVAEFLRTHSIKIRAL